MDASEGFPGRRRNVLAAVRSVRRIFQTDDSVYSSLIMANVNSRATLVSSSVKGVGSFRLLGTLASDIDGDLMDWTGEVLFVDVTGVIISFFDKAGDGEDRIIP